MRTRPWTMLLAMMAGWMNRQQHDMIDYLKEENKILRVTTGPRRRLNLIGLSNEVIAKSWRLNSSLAEIGKKLVE